MKSKTLTILFVSILIVLLLPKISLAAIKTVCTSGCDYSLIQDCANNARPGDTCLVYEGNYPEHIRTVTGGTDDSNRITFKAQGLVTMQGFDINHPYVTIDGFDITGYTTRYYGHINVNPRNPYSGAPGGHYCEILNNTIRDGAETIKGIYFYYSSDAPVSNCVVRNNSLRNLRGTFLNVQGENHLFENNVFERLNNMDYIYLFGHGHIFRRNIFREGNAVPGVSNHPDWVQTFGDNGIESYDMLFEENWIENIEAQLGQLNSGGGSRGIIPNIRDWVFRKNVFVNVSNNFNIGLPGVIFTQNTLYRVAYTQGGIGFSGSLTRGETSRTAVKNNVFFAGGGQPNTPNHFAGFYWMNGVQLTTEVLRTFATNETYGNDPIAQGIAKDLVVNGYLFNTNGGLTAKARNLTDISQFVMSDTYSSYKNKVYDLLISTVPLDNLVRNTTIANYNFVAGAPPEYYPKRSESCSEGIFTPFNFCEIHGINGGDPKLANPENPLGPDGIPFTLDDGLKPLPNSPLCGKGELGLDIGAYSCDPNKVLVDDLPTIHDRIPPAPPTGLRIQ